MVHAVRTGVKQLMNNGIFERFDRISLIKKNTADLNCKCAIVVRSAKPPPMDSPGVYLKHAVPVRDVQHIKLTHALVNIHIKISHNIPPCSVFLSTIIL